MADTGAKLRGPLSDKERALVMFEMAGKRIKFVLPLPVKKARQK